MFLHFSFAQICLLLALSQCNNGQEYESGYDIDEGETDVEDDSGPVDYSKYYNVDTSSPLVSQGNQEIGFTHPIEFAGFFGPSIGKTFIKSSFILLNKLQILGQVPNRKLFSQKILLQLKVLMVWVL